MTALLDTGFLYALTDTGDALHPRVLAVARQLAEPLILPVPVLPEVCYLISSRLGHAAMRRFVTELSAWNVRLESLTPADLHRIVDLLTEYSDLRLDFVDATLVAIAERENVTRLLTVDRRDFTVIRPRHCEHFELLPA